MAVGSILNQAMLWLDIGMIVMTLMVLMVPRVIAKDFKEQPAVAFLLMVFIVVFWPFALSRFITRWRRSDADTE